MIDCSYCGGRYERDNHCPNCGAPNIAKSNAPATPVAQIDERGIRLPRDPLIVETYQR